MMCSIVRSRGAARSGAVLPALAALAVLSAACGSSESHTFTAPAQARCTINLAVENTAFAAAGGSGAVRITSGRECQWTASADASWVSLSSREGQGDGSVSFTVASNGDPASRNTSISVNDQRVQIAQQGSPCAFTLSSHHEVADAAGGDRAIQVRASSAQCTWTAGASDPWIDVTSGAEGRGDGEVSFRITPASGPPRSGTLTIAGERVLVEQGTGCSYNIAPATVSVPSSGGEREIAVTAGAGCPWTADTTTPWIAILNASTGSGPGVIGFRVPATGEPERTGTLRVAGRTVTVVQADGCSVSAGPSSVSAQAAGATSQIQVETGDGCGWSVASEVPWITVAGPASGSGRAAVPLVIGGNTGPARSGAVVISGHRIVVSQASGCSYGVTPAGSQVSGTGGQMTAAVATAPGCAWVASSPVDWITIGTASGSGPGSASFTVAPNLTPARSASLTIAGQSLMVSQASSCTWSFAPPSTEMPASGGSGITLVLLSGGQCSWTATSAAPWIQIVSVASGPGSGHVQFVVSANTGPARTGTILIGGERYSITQQATR